MEYNLKKLRKLYFVKVIVIYTIVTFLINQAIEAMVIAEFIPVLSLRVSLIITAVLFPFVMYVAWVIIYKREGEESYEEQFLNRLLLISSVLMLLFAFLEQFLAH